MCEELKVLKHNAARVLREVKKIRRSRDISILEDAALNQHKHKTLHLVLKHLLVGHGGKPCPAGTKPVVSLSMSTRFRWVRSYSLSPVDYARDAMSEALLWAADWIRIAPLTIVRPSQSAERSSTPPALGA
jgi:hypothetical protein